MRHNLAGALGPSRPPAHERQRENNSAGETEPCPFGKRTA